MHLPLIPSLLRRGEGEVRLGRMTKIYNRTCEKRERRTLRSNMPKAEVVLWSRLKNKGLERCKFRRQYSVGKFVIDFYCPQWKLAIEVDGDSHFSERSEVCDRERQNILESFGISFLRFTNKDIYENLNEVLATIQNRIQNHSVKSCGGGSWKR